MYPSSAIRYLNLPALPQELADSIPRDFDAYEKKIQGKKSVGYVWTDSHNHAVDAWCKKNICDSVYFAYQIISGDMVIHKDQGTKTKFIYLLQSGGSDVWTEFYAEDQVTVIQREKIELNRWVLMKVDCYHRVVGVEPGKVRFAITARVFD